MSYNHPADHNLHDLHKAMQYNGAGQPEIRVTGGSGGGTSSSVGITNWPAIQTVDGNVGITGNVTVDNFPAVQSIDDNGGSLTIDGTVSVDNFPAVQTVDGDVNVLNHPSVYPINDNGGSITIDGTISVDNFPAIQTVDGNVGITGNVTVDNFPAVQPINDNGGSITIDGNITVDNFPVTTTVTGTVDIGSIPEVEIKNDIGNPIPISGNITVDNFPVTTTVTGTVDIGTMPGVEIINDISNPIPINYVPGIGANKPFYLEIAQGVIAGYSHNHKFGAVPALSNNTVGSIWDVSDTLYPFDALGAGGVVNIKRNNGGDNGITVTVQGLDPDFNFVEEDIVISGPNNLGSTLFVRVNRAFITGTGITTNAGNIDIEAGAAGGTIIARISAGYGQTLMAVYTVPANKSMYLLNLTSTASDDSDATVLLMKKEIGSDIFRIMSTFELQQRGGGYEHSFNIPLSVVEKTDIDMRAITRSNNKRITGTFDMILVDN